MEARERKKEVTYNRKSAIHKMDIWCPEFRLAGSIFAHENALYLQKWVEDWNWQEPSNLYAYVKLVQLLYNAFLSSPIAVTTMNVLQVRTEQRLLLLQGFVIFKSLVKGVGNRLRFSWINTYQRIPYIFFNAFNLHSGML